jgi:hypothetical protein
MWRRAPIVFHAIIVAFLVFFLNGCIIGHYTEGPEFMTEKIEEIKPGITTKEEIINWFGPPQNYVSPTVFNQILSEMNVTKEPLTTYPFANILVYQRDEGRIRALVLILFNHAEFRVKSDHLVIFIDNNERVKYFGFRRGTEEFE